MNIAANCGAGRCLWSSCRWLQDLWIVLNVVVLDRQFQGSLAAAKRTVEFLRTLVSHKQPDVQALMDEVREVGVKLQMAMPTGVMQ